MTPRASAILSRIASDNGFKVADLIGPSKAYRLAAARQQAYAELHALQPKRWKSGPYSMPQIAKLMGDRHPTTILHGVRAHAARQAVGE